MPDQLNYQMAPARTKSEQIADAIAKDIIDGVFKAEEKLSEVQLAKRFGVSRGPVRDALDLLERNMLVTIKPRSYTRVNRITANELEQLYTFRRHILGLAAQYAAKHRTLAGLDKLNDGFERIEEVLASNEADITFFTLPAAQMWDVIIAASHSPIVNQACMHFTGANIWSTAVQDKIAEASFPNYRSKRLKLWQSLIRSITKGNETGAYLAGDALVKDNWQFLATVFEHYFPEGHSS